VKERNLINDKSSRGVYRASPSMEQIYNELKFLLTTGHLWFYYYQKRKLANMNPCSFNLRLNSSSVICYPTNLLKSVIPRPPLKLLTSNFNCDVDDFLLCIAFKSSNATQIDEECQLAWLQNPRCIELNQDLDSLLEYVFLYVWYFFGCPNM
jgi:hypothetical protein